MRLEMRNKLIAGPSNLAGQTEWFMPSDPTATITAGSSCYPSLMHITVMQNRLAIRLCEFTIAACFASCGWIAADEPGASTDDNKPLAYWIEELDHNQFLRRQAASQRLLSMGNEAVQPLADITSRGRLELTERAITVLQTLALNQAPDDEAGAFGALTQLVEQGSGSAALRSRAALEAIRREREQEAVERLTAAGVKLGYREFVIDSRAPNENLVWIDSAWNGDVDALRWLRWIRGAAYAVVEGAAVHADVLHLVVQMPDLRTIVLRESKLDSDVFSPLEKLSRIDELEFRYISLSAADAARIAKLPIRVQLNLIGTGLPAEALVDLRAAMPGLNVIYRQGGFLGVRCNNLTPDCQIDSVVAGGAAEKSGLMPGDVIVSIDGVAIQRFDDLQAQVGKHVAGDEIEITYDRLGEKVSTKVTLQRMSAE